MRKNTTLSLAMAMFFLVAANVKAETVTFAWDLAKTKGATESLQSSAEGFTFTATDIGSGIKFVFTNPVQANSNGSGNNYGYGEFHQNSPYLYFYGIDNIFTNAGAGGTFDDLGGKSERPEGYSIDKDTISAFTYSTNGYAPVKEDGKYAYGELAFTLIYAEDYNWVDFTGYLDTLVIGMGFQGLNGGSFPFFATYAPETETVTPEPATLAVLGLGLAGLGLARARRRK